MDNLKKFWINMRKLLIIFIVVINLFIPTESLGHEKIKNVVYVYKDDGVSDESLMQIIQTIKRHLGSNHIIKTIGANDVKRGKWMKSAVVFVMPGGADLPYVKKLNGIGNTKIKRYVEEGGSYLGICAGSYYASSYVEFDKGGSFEVLGNRELRFFGGKAIGPILAPYDYKTQSGSRAAKIKTIFQKLPEVTVYYNGGGYFENAENFNDTQVIAYYQNKLPAIIHVKYGKGNVILSGVHFEYNPDLLNPRDQYLQKIIPELKKSTKSREKLINALFKIL